MSNRQVIDTDKAEFMEWAKDQLKNKAVNSLDTNEMIAYQNKLWEDRISMSDLYKITLDEVGFEAWIKEQLKQIKSSDDQQPVSYVAYNY